MKWPTSLLAGVVLGALIAPATTSAATIKIDRTWQLGVTYTAAPGEANDVQVTIDENGATLEDTGVASIDWDPSNKDTPGRVGCAARTPTRWFCGWIYEGGDKQGHVKLALGDGNDTGVAEARDDASVSGTIDGGDGDDQLRGTTHRRINPGDLRSNLYVDGGAGADAMTGDGIVTYETRTTPVTVRLGTSTPAGDAGGIDGAGDTIGADIQGVWGGKGNDTLVAAPGTGINLDGSLGDDTVTGSDQQDELSGGDGNDTVHGGGDNDYVTGDLFFGHEDEAGVTGNDTIDGGEGLDTVIGGPGNDTVRGGNGRDSLGGGDGADDISGGGGHDFVSIEPMFDLPEDRTVDLDDVADDGGVSDGHGDNYRTDIEELWGGTGADTITGSDGPDQINGSGGGDVIDGRGGDDVLVDGGDTTYGAVDSIRGGDGNDRIDGGVGADFLDGGAGDDEVDGGAGTSGDRLTGGAGDDKLYGYHPLQRWSFSPWRGDSPTIDAADTFDAGAGDDVIYATDGKVDDADCGADADIAFADATDATDALTGCEIVDNGPLPIRARAYVTRHQGLTTKDDLQGVDPDAPFATLVDNDGPGGYVAVEQARRVLDPAPAAGLIPFEANVTLEGGGPDSNEPYLIRFLVHPSQWPATSALEPRYNGAPIPDCGPNDELVADPCFADAGVETSTWHRLAVWTTKSGRFNLWDNKPPDVAPPLLRVTTLGKPTLKTAVKRGLGVPLRASERVSATVDLMLDRKTAKRLKLPRKIGTATKSLTRRGKLTVKFTKRAAAKLKKRRGGLVVSVNAKAADAAGNKSRTASKKLRLR